MVGYERPSDLDVKCDLAHYSLMNLVLHSERLTFTPFDQTDVDLAIEMFTDPEVLEFAGGAVTEHVIRKELPNWVEIGYFFKRSAWGKGYATETCKRLLQFAFEESPLTEVVATFEQGNVASRYVLKKAGFVDRGMRRAYGEVGPNYRVTRNEWRESRLT